MYINNNKGTVIPCGTPNGGWWSNILVDYNYTTARTLSDAEVTAGAGPVTEGVFYCPSGNADMFPPDLTSNGSIPADRQDERGATCWQSKSNDTNTWVHLWYGMNANGGRDNGNDLTKGTPGRRIEDYKLDGYIKMSNIRSPSEIAFLYDGLIYHQQSVNASRINARHNKKKATNISFLDGHSETPPTASLPGGMKPTTADFSLANLQAKSPYPKWLLEQ